MIISHFSLSVPDFGAVSRLVISEHIGRKVRAGVVTALALAAAFAPAGRATTISYTDGQDDSTPYTTTTGNPLSLFIDTGAAVQSGLIDGNGGLTKTGTGTVTLSAENTYTGGTTLSAGTLAITNGNALGTAGTISFEGGTLEIGPGFSIAPPEVFARFSNAAGQAYNIRITEDGYDYITSALTSVGGTLRKEGTGTLELFGANTYNGGTTINGGTIIATVTTLPGNVQIDSGGTLNLIQDGGRYTGTMSGTGALHLAPDGGNSLIISGNQTGFTGDRFLDSGVIIVGSAEALGNAGTIHLNGATLKYSSSPSYDYSARFSSDPGQSYIIDATGSVAYASDLTSEGGILVKSGIGTLTLSGNNTYSGGSTLSAGFVTVRSDTALGTGIVVLDGSTLISDGGPRTLANNFRLTGDTTISGSQPLTITGSFTLLKNRDLRISNLTTISGVISQAGGGRGLNKYGPGELRLTGANTYTGGTYIGQGTVRINNTTGSAFGTGAVTVEAGATLAGSGSFTGALQLNGIYSPGNSPGTGSPGATNWAGGGGYVWELNNASDAPGAKGVTYDWMNIGGQLSVDSTSDSKFTIYVTSLTAGNAPGTTPGFVYGTTYHWTIATATSVANFSADKFLINTSGFFNDPNTTGFTITQSGNDIILTYTAVPEPSTYALGIAALLGGAILLRRRRISSRK